MKHFPKVRPGVEVLENRLVPAAVWWEGDMSSTWTNGANWLGDVAPGAGDEALLLVQQGIPNVFSPTIYSDTLVELKAIHVDASFAGRTLTIEQYAILRLTGTIAEVKSSQWINDTDIVGGGTLDIQGDFVWRAGDLSVNSVEVASTGRLLIDGGTKLFGPTYASIWGTMQIGGGAMTGNVWVQESLQMTVQSGGSLVFDATDTSETTGSLGRMGLAPLPIQVYGQVVREGSGSLVQSEVAFAIQDGGELIIGAENAFKVYDSIADEYDSITVYSGGKVHMGHDSDLYLSGTLLLDGGALLTYGDLDYSVVYIEGNLDVWYGSDVFVTVNGAPGELEVHGNINIYGGVFHMSVIGGLGYDNDLITCWGGILYFDKWNSASLHVTTTGVPFVGDEFPLFAAVHNQIALDAEFSSYEFLGDFTDYQYGLLDQEGFIWGVWR